MMLRHLLFLLFLYGIKSCGGSSSNSDAQEQIIEPKDSVQNGIKKNEIGANGLEVNSEKVLRNFRNPVLEYLLHNNSDKAKGPAKTGIIREIRHSQTLLMPHPLRSPLPGVFFNQMPQFESNENALKDKKYLKFNTWAEKVLKPEDETPQKLKKPSEEETREPERSPVENFWNFLKNKTQLSENKTYESVVSSPVLHLNKDADEMKEDTRIQTYPAVAIVINSFSKDGSLKKSVTHFQPDFNSLRLRANDRGEAITRASNANELQSDINNSQYSVKNFIKGESDVFEGSSRQGLQWPFANYFPIVVNDPFLGVHNAFATSMYNAVSSMVEYGPEADMCTKDHQRDSNSNFDKAKVTRTELLEQMTPAVFGRYSGKQSGGDIFDEVTMRSESLKRINRRPLASVRPKEGFQRRKRDATSIFVKSREGETVAITLEEPPDVNVVSPNTQDERARSFSQVLVNTPPLSTILRPPQQESRQFLGYADKKRKTKPTKPAKEEGSSEEVGEEQEEESTSQSQESANEAVAISPPPEGASVAEAKPIGLAIAGPGGVAASKPQGTAVAGPGGLAIARPVGTAIAGVDVEGSVPIGGQQKNKKKPKQEQEQTEGELHYVGGLTGPIGNPQPKEFADSIYYKTVKETEGNTIQENLFFRGVPNANGFQLRLGQLNGNNAQNYDGFPKYQTQF